MIKKLPVLIDIHAEPDNHYLALSEKEDWYGFERGTKLILDIKKDYPQLKLSWLIRADPQIGLVYGDNSWGLKKYKDTIDMLLATGDEIGVHMHPYRFHETGEQSQDYSDFEYLKKCMDDSVTAFQQTLGHSPLILANTVGTTSTELVNYNRSVGFKYDLSLNKDSRTNFPEHLGMYVGQRSSGIDFPSHIYCPASEDYRVEHINPDEYRMIPIQCFKIPAHSSVKNWIGRKLKGLSVYKVVKTTLAEHPPYFQKILNGVIEDETSYLVIDSRSDIFNYDLILKRIKKNLNFLLNHKEIKLVTPDNWLGGSQNENTFR